MTATSSTCGCTSIPTSASWAAITSPPHLVAIAPGQTATDYHDHWTYVNGVFDLWFGQSWPLAFFSPDAHRRQQLAQGAALEDARRMAEEYLSEGEQEIFSDGRHHLGLTGSGYRQTGGPRLQLDTGDLSRLVGLDVRAPAQSVLGRVRGHLGRVAPHSRQIDEADRSFDLAWVE